MRDFLFSDKQRESVVLFHNDRFTVLDTATVPLSFHKALTPIKTVCHHVKGFGRSAKIP